MNAYQTTVDYINSHTQGDVIRTRDIIRQSINHVKRDTIASYITALGAVGILTNVGWGKWRLNMSIPAGCSMWSMDVARGWRNVEYKDTLGIGWNYETYTPDRSKTFDVLDYVSNHEAQ
jgi:CO dehydrogenase/acetyl-CoA synthase alpha subunit